MKILLTLTLVLAMISVFGQNEKPLYSNPDYSKKYTENQLAPVLKPGKIFYVSAEGSDRNIGTKNKPFQTIDAVRDTIRQLKKYKGLPAGGVKVILLKGTYHISQTINFSEEDAGTAEAPIVYSTEAAGKVILTSGKEIDSKRFSVVNDKALLERLNPVAKGKVMSVDLSKDNISGYFPGEGNYGELSMDGYMLQLSQWPNRGYNHIGEIVEEGPTTRWLKPGEKPMPFTKENPTGGKFVIKEEISPAIQKEFERSRDMRAQGYFHNDWYFQDEPVGRIAEGEIQLLHHTRYGIVNKIKTMPRRVRLFNVLAELDEPGEWYFDKKEQRLYVWPIKGFEPGKSTVTVVGSQNVSINSSFEQPSEQVKSSADGALIVLDNTSYLTFRDFVIENTGNLAISVSGGKYNLLAGCTFRNGAGKGAKIEGGKHNGITGCDFYDLYSAFSISGGDFKTLDHSFNFATNNIIRNCRYRGYGVIALSGVGLYFAHNLLHSMNGAVMYQTVNLLMEYNEYYNIGYEMGDFNVAYCGANWFTMNNVVRFNFVHHLIEPGGHPICAFRNDDNGAGLKLYGNVFYRPGRAAIQGDGPLNEFWNNIVLDCNFMWWTLKKPIDKEGIQQRWDDLAKFGCDLPKGDKGDYIYIMEQKIGKDGWKKGIWKETFPELEEAININPWAQTFGNISLNYAWKVRDPFHIHGGDGSIEGMESNESGRFRDLPMDGKFVLPEAISPDVFVDFKSLDLRLKDSFQPMDGYKPIPFEKIGLVKDDFRTNLPDTKE